MLKLDALRTERRDEILRLARERGAHSLRVFVQVQLVILHSGVASRRILSRMFQCRDFSVLACTLAPTNS
jgi:hypothetical protein